MKSMLFATVIVATTLCSNAMAEQGAWLGLALGESDLDVSADDLDDGSFVLASADSKSTSFRVAGGYDFNDNFGIEASYTDFGSASVTAISDGSGALWSAGNVDATLDGTSMNFGVNGYLPFNAKVKAVGRFGISMWDSDGSVSNGGLRFSATDDGSDPYFGVGVEGEMGSRVSGGLSYVRYDFDDANVSSIELGLKMHLK